MRRESALQIAVVAVLVGVMLLLLGGGGVDRQHPTSTTWRLLTPEERQQYDRDQLAEILLEQSRR